MADIWTHIIMVDLIQLKFVLYQGGSPKPRSYTLYIFFPNFPPCLQYISRPHFVCKFYRYTHTPGMAQPPLSFRSMLTNSRMPRPVSSSRTIWSAALSRFQRVTIGSAAWLGPQRPSTPRPRSPVRPWVFSSVLLCVNPDPWSKPELDVPGRDENSQNLLPKNCNTFILYKRQ
jgi:hypothetical protein